VNVTKSSGRVDGRSYDHNNTLEYEKGKKDDISAKKEEPFRDFT